MADIAAGDVTYVLQSEQRVNSYYNAVFKLTFGNGALTYPALGIPLTAGKLGCPVVIKSLKIFDNSDGDGLLYKYDFEGNKIRIYNTVGAHAHDLLVKGGQAAASTDAVSIKTATLGKEAATDRTALGSASATSGGVMASTAANGTESGNVAIAATVIYVEVVGY